MITTPFCLYDCDVPCDGATAVIVSRRDRAQDLRNPPLRVEAVGTAHRTAARRGTSSTTSPRWRTATPARSCGTRTDLKPCRRADGAAVRRVLVITMSWLEALGFCGVGESGPFIEGGDAHRARRRAAAQHPRRPAVGRPAARLRLPARGRDAAVGRGRRPPDRHARPRSASSPPAAATPAAACSSSASDAAALAAVAPAHVIRVEFPLSRRASCNQSRSNAHNRFERPTVAAATPTAIKVASAR